MTEQLVYLYVIAPRKQKNALVAELLSAGGAAMDFVYGRGYYDNRGVLDYFGFRSNAGKVVISCLISREKSLPLIDTLNEKYDFKTAGTGIAFTIPVERLVF